MSQDAPGTDRGAAGAGSGRRTATQRPRSLAFHRDFRQLWIGDGFGQLGAQLTVFVLPVYALTVLGADAWEMGVLAATETAAFLLIGLPAGAWVDRMRKRRVLVVADLLRATVLAVVVATAVTGNASMPLLYASALVLGSATVFFDVAHQSYVPGLVGLDRVVEGNAKLQATASVAVVVAPAVGGALLRVLSAPVLVAVTVLTYLGSALAVGRIRQHESLPDRSGRRPLRAEVAEGLRFVVEQPLLRRIVACTSVSFRQRLCPPALLGRMNASVRFIVWGTMPLGGLLGGWLGTTIGVVPTLWVAVAGTAVGALPVALSPLRSGRRLPGADDAATPA